MNQSDLSKMSVKIINSSNNPRKNFDFQLLTLFLNENIEFFKGARFQKIQQPTRQEFIFTLRNQGESRKFYVNISPNFFHLCFMSEKNEEKRFIEIPKKPPMFCMLLRKYLEGAKVAKICQPENERILEFYFETYNELSEKIYLCLAIELMGKHSNVVLYNYDTNVIIGCAHNVGAEKSSVREMMGSLPYAYPPKHDNKAFFGLSSDLKSESCVNEFIDDFFADYQQAEKIKSIKTKLTSVAGAKLKKIVTTLGKIQNQSTSSEKANLYRKKGDLIMANLFHHKDFSSFVEVLDFETNSLLKIELDKTKTLKENANQYFKLYNKAKVANLKSQEMIENLRMEKDYLEQVLYSLENARTVDELLEIANEGTVNSKQQTANKNHKTIQPFNCSTFQPKTPLTPNPSPARGEGRSSETVHRSPFTVYPSSHLSLLTIHHPPFTIYVGKNNKQNDYIVSKLSRDEDLWFHVHNCAGSHVLLRLESGQEPDDEIIFECAKLAKEYSSAKNSSKVGVIYTKRKFLKKPSGAKLGYVTYKNEKEIIID